MNASERDLNAAMYRHLKDIIREEMEIRCVTVNAFVEQSGVNHTTTSRILSGEWTGNFYPKTWDSIAKWLGVSIPSLKLRLRDLAMGVPKEEATKLEQYGAPRRMWRAK